LFVQKPTHLIFTDTFLSFQFPVENFAKRIVLMTRWSRYIVADYFSLNSTDDS